MPITSDASQVSPFRPGDVLSIDLSLLDDNPFQPRKAMDPTKLAELMASLAQSGLLQPIVVRAIGPGRYQVVVGHRRTEAFRRLLAAATTDDERRKYTLIRAQVVAMTDAQMAVAAYVENSQRVDLNPLEEAAAIAQIRQLGGHSTAAQVAKATGQPERRVGRLLRLFAAPPVVKDAVTKGLLIETPEEAGAPPKREHRKLDLLAALEFARLHEHHAAKKPKSADERTTNAILRALTHNWGLRRIQTWIDSVINGTAPAEPITDTHPAATARSVPPKDKGTDERGDHEPHDVCSSSSDRFTLYLSRLKAASEEQLEAARTTVDDIRQLIEAQLQLKRTTPG